MAHDVEPFLAARWRKVRAEQVKVGFAHLILVRATGIALAQPRPELVRYEVDMHRVKRGALVLGMGDGRVLADDRLIYTAKDMKVGLIKPAIAEVG